MLPAPIDPRRASAALIALSIGTFAFVTTEVLPIGLLPLIADGLRRTPAEVGRIVTGYAIVVVLVSLPLTRLTTRVPRRPLLTATLGVSAAGMVVAALAPDYRTLLIARLVVAGGQALFWSIVGPTVAGLFAAEVRGRVLGRLAVGTSLAPVLGVPLGTWLGEQAGWRVAFGALTVLMVATGVAVAVLLPGAAGGDEQARRAPEPSAGRYALVVVTTAIGVTGFEIAFTYITLFLLRVSHFGSGALPSLLLVTGVTGVLGALTVGRYLDRYAWGAVTAPLLLVVLALLALWAAGTNKLAAIGALALLGFAFSGYAPALQNLTMRVAPGRPDLATAGGSSAFNVGIGAGSLLGGVLVDGAGVRTATLVGALVTAVAVAMLALPMVMARRVPARVPACEPAPAG